jgi:hypothetical protein
VPDLIDGLDFGAMLADKAFDAKTPTVVKFG